MSDLYNTYGVFQCGFCGRQETSTPALLKEAGWDVIPYKSHNLCPHCELRGWIAKTLEQRACSVSVPPAQQSEDMISKTVGPPIGEEKERNNEEK